MQLLALGGLGPWEIALILGVALLLFGGKKLPELAKGLGRGLRVFKNEVKGVQDDVSSSVNSDDDIVDDRPSRHADTDSSSKPAGKGKPKPKAVPREEATSEASTGDHSDADKA